MSEKYPNTLAGVGSASLLYGKLVPWPVSFSGIKYISRLCLNLLRVSEAIPWIDGCNYFANWSSDKTAFVAGLAGCVAGSSGCVARRGKAETPGATGPGTDPDAGGGAIGWGLEVIFVYNYIQKGIKRKSIFGTRRWRLYRQV